MLLMMINLIPFLILWLDDIVEARFWIDIVCDSSSTLFLFIEKLALLGRVVLKKTIPNGEFSGILLNTNKCMLANASYC